MLEVLGMLEVLEMLEAPRMLEVLEMLMGAANARVAGDTGGGLGCSKTLGIVEVLGMLELARDAEGTGGALAGAAHTNIWGRGMGCCLCSSLSIPKSWKVSPGMTWAAGS